MNKTIACLAAVLILPGPLFAQAWPERAVRVVVPYSAGSTPDGLARTLFSKVSENTGQTFIVDNRPGASAMVGTNMVAKAKPDGHTLVFASSGPMDVNTLLFKEMPYDPFNDLKPITLAAHGHTVLVVSNSVKAQDAKGLLQEVAANGSKYAYGTSGVGSGQHLSLADLFSRGGADVVHVPFGGIPQVVAALISDNIQIAALPVQTAVTMIQAHRLRAIAAFGSERAIQLPDLPTLKEQGVDFSTIGWMGVATTARTPPAVANAIHAQIAKALQDSEVGNGFRKQGFEPAIQSQDEFRKFMLGEVERWRPVIKRNSIMLQ
ncbi:Bug family tripartite tricarboxylate transporter substrate binding protein [Pigmentiphaga kullae]|uniref:Tripartite-type tricarboxylate transporter receptor subunit TctC n=1 Tax=Pigmentiphaga kullae TaxID=151784 RepID=A0A4Q7NNM1_9BURK|nr:tripartite tricarboxylate transporter substrate binding protein [Pigmentiphaga kullae]RZS86608.1 tripartite-type tricarboxylate transporter receptor subunit TctC [Pigmentiphaga kullae]